jgi:putrescine---pyruvate transaminase
VVEIRGDLGLAAAVDLNADLLAAGAMGPFTAAIRDAGVLLRGQATGVAVGPPLTVEREQLVEIAQAIRAGLDAVVA